MKEKDCFKANDIFPRSAPDNHPAFLPGDHLSFATVTPLLIQLLIHYIYIFYFPPLFLLLHFCCPPFDTHRELSTAVHTADLVYYLRLGAAQVLQRSEK